MDDRYLTIAREATTEIKVKASRFIGETCLVESVDEALARLTAIRKREHAATHHCFAYRVGLGEQFAFKYSDGGEPSGTAGKPIYDIIEGQKLTQIILIVTRYFGGTKLGTGGLAHAYGDAARLVLEKSGVKENFIWQRFRFQLDFPLYDRWRTQLHRLAAREIESSFTDIVASTVEVRLSRAEELRQAFVELTGGKGICEPEDA
ncbi:MAG TPA: YigZ family protein [Candidatus Acidoferrum sp.]|nr:YigZ family protein [Candidatus Acidoferrum sp.]